MQEAEFEVPPGTASIVIDLDYDASRGVVDLGCAGADGFRGWSGGARTHVEIGGSSATPGYYPGPPEAGRWAALLGLHRMPAEGLQTVLHIGLSSHDCAPTPPPSAVRDPQRPARRVLPAPPGWVWLAGDLHAHTVHSDGALSVTELAGYAVEQGLDFLAVTDHNTTSHHTELADAGTALGVALLPGQEVTTDLGHANCFGDVGWVDFRQPAEQWLAYAERTGGLLSVNHPLAADCCWRQPLPGGSPLLEVWHSSWLDTRWGGPLAWWRAWAPHAAPIGGSDFHSPTEGRPLGEPTTWVLVPDDVLGNGTVDPRTTTPAVLNALRAGRTSVTADRHAPALLRAGNELTAVGGDGTVLVDADGSRKVVRGVTVTLAAGTGPHFLEAPDGAILALSS